MTDHYAGSGDLAVAIAEALGAAGLATDGTPTSALAPIDEFHIRGRQASLEIAQALRVNRASTVLDIGCGLGGPARTVAEVTGAQVTGVDLTPAFVAAATTLSMWTGLSDRTSFVEGDATALPLPDTSFDGAMSVHVGMNVADKAALYREARRVLRPGSRFVVYDVVRGPGPDVRYPVPWARDPSTSFLVSMTDMSRLLEGAGFSVLDVTDSTAAGLVWFEQMAARAEGSSSPPVTFATFLGEDFALMARNQVANLREGAIQVGTFVCEA